MHFKRNVVRKAGFIFNNGHIFDIGDNEHSVISKKERFKNNIISYRYCDKHFSLYITIPNIKKINSAQIKAIKDLLLFYNVNEIYLIVDDKIYLFTNEKELIRKINEKKYSKLDN